MTDLPLGVGERWPYDLCWASASHRFVQRTDGSVYVVDKQCENVGSLDLGLCPDHREEIVG